MPDLFRSALIFLTLASAVSAGSSVWRVSRGDRVLYLGGTCHLLRPADYPLPAEFDLAYGQAGVLVFETDIDALSGPAFQQLLLTRGMLPEGQTLEQVLAAPTYQALAAYCAEAGLPVARLSRFKPALVMVTLSSMALMKQGMGQQGVDMHYFRQAGRDAKTVAWLESPEAQMEIMVTLGEGNEDQLVMQTLDDLKGLAAELGPVLAAWRSGDLARLDETMVQEMKRDAPAVYQTLFAKRNRAWLPLIEARLAAGPTALVLVGAGHLVGDDGLLHLLQQQGCRIEQLEAAPAPATP